MIRLGHYYKLDGNAYVALPDTETPESPRLYLQQVDAVTLRPLCFTYGYVVGARGQLSGFDPECLVGSVAFWPTDFTVGDLIPVLTLSRN